MRASTKLVLALIRTNDNVVELYPTKLIEAETPPQKPNGDAALKDFFDRSKYFE